jgi:predicted methyltransferase
MEVTVNSEDGMTRTLLKLVGSALLATAMLAVPTGAVAADTGRMIEEAMNGSYRSDAYKARNQYRHPQATLLFFGLQPDMSVVEITPGRGWYSEIVAPVLRDDGAYYAAAYRITEDSPGFFRRMDADLRAKRDTLPEIFGNMELVYFDRAMPEFVPSGSVDMVLTFRNVHNWAKAGSAEAMFGGFFDALKPGGVLGVVEHRAKPGTSLQRQIRSGYMTEEYVIELATRAGFQLAGRSEANANPKDSADHPGGVWNLPPSSRNVPDGDAERMRQIGESDRMTLKFVKR